MFIWVVVPNIFYVHPYLGKIPILTNIFQMGWNHQLVIYCKCRIPDVPLTSRLTFRLRHGVLNSPWVATWEPWAREAQGGQKGMEVLEVMILP